MHCVWLVRFAAPLAAPPPQIFNLFTQRKPNVSYEWQVKLPDFVRRLEEALYRTATSEAAYKVRRGRWRRRRGWGGGERRKGRLPRWQRPPFLLRATALY